MSEQDDCVEELQQLLDECVVALGSKALRWDEIVAEICKLCGENENRKLSVEHQISKRQLAETENAELKKALKLSLSIIVEGIDEYWQEENQDRIDKCGDAAVNALKGNSDARG